MESNTLPWPAVRDNAVAAVPAALEALEVAAGRAVPAGRVHLVRPHLDREQQHHPCRLQRQRRRLRRSFPVYTCTCWTARLRIRLRNLRPLRPGALVGLAVRLRQAAPVAPEHLLRLLHLRDAADEVSKNRGEGAWLTVVR